MPHGKGDPVLCMSPNQKRVYQAYGCIPIWLTEAGALQCTYCNSGDEGCLKSCLLANVMDKMRADVRYLDAEDARRGIPVTHLEMADRFRKFCFAEDVQSLVSGERLYKDFVDRHRILYVLQGLGPWLEKEAKRYAEAGGVHNQDSKRLSLKCERAVVLFLRLELDALNEEDTIILCNVIESSGIPEAFNNTLQTSLQRVLDLLSIVNAVKEMQRRDGSLLLKEMQWEQEQLKAEPQTLTKETSHLPTSSTVLSLPSPPPPPSPLPLSSSISLPSSASGSRSLSLSSSPVESFEDDPATPNRCRGRTKAGARCKLTEESVHKLHGRCAEAAEPLSRGAHYCKFHRDQEPLF